MDGLDIPFEIPLLAESSSHDTIDYEYLSEYYDWENPEAFDAVQQLGSICFLCRY
jgi:hypothetical protein